LSAVKEKVQKAKDAITGGAEKGWADKIDEAVTKYESSVRSLCQTINEIKPPETAYYVVEFGIKKKEQKPVDRVWHAVKVVSAVPGRCSGLCGTDRFPWIRPYVASFGFKACRGLSAATEMSS